MFTALTLLFSVVAAFGSFRRYYPIFIFLVFAWGNRSNEIAFGVGSNTIEFVYLGSLIFFARSLEFVKNRYITKLLITTFIIYGIYIILRFFIDDISIIESYKYSRPLIVQVNILTTIIFCTRYGVKPLLLITFLASISFMGYTLYMVITRYTMAFFHNASFGLAAAVVVAINLFYAEEIVPPRFRLLSKSIGFAGIVAVFLGMSRGAMTAVILPFIMMFMFDKTKRSKGLVFFLVIGALVFVSSFLMSNIVPTTYVYQHQGARNLSELLEISQNISTISTRLLRWEYLINGFVSNPLMGVGFYESKSIFASFRDAWQAHNYFLAILGGGGLLLFVPNVILAIYPVKQFLSKIPFINQNENPEILLGFVLFLQVLNINLFNTYYYQMWSAVYIWCLLGIAFYLLTADYLLNKFQFSDA
jgi:hypothetical protein